jgi:transcriptional regulator with XRE-family HTH domain
VHTSKIDLDLLATHLRQGIEDSGNSMRACALEIGVSPATLSRMLQGEAAENYPDSRNLFKAASWLERRLSDFEVGSAPSDSTLADVEVHLRALKGLNDSDQEALVAMVKAAYDAARQLRSEKS